MDMEEIERQIQEAFDKERAAQEDKLLKSGEVKNE